MRQKSIWICEVWFLWKSCNADFVQMDYFRLTVSHCMFESNKNRSWKDILTFLQICFIDNTSKPLLFNSIQEPSDQCQFKTNAKRVLMLLLQWSHNQNFWKRSIFSSWESQASARSNPHYENNLTDIHGIFPHKFVSVWSTSGSAFCDRTSARENVTTIYFGRGLGQSQAVELKHFKKGHVRNTESLTVRVGSFTFWNSSFTGATLHVFFTRLLLEQATIS